MSSVSLFSGGVEYAGALSTISNGSETTLAYDIATWGEEKITWPELVADTSSPIFVAHRGGSASWPEMTAQAYWESAVIWGMSAIEISVQWSADGTPWCLHDPTTNRVTGFSGTIANMTDAALGELTVSASATDNAGQHRRPLAKLTDILALYAGKRVIFIEDKTGSHQSQLLDLMDINGGPDWFVWKCDALGALYSDSRLNGLTHEDGKYDSWGYIFDANMATSFSNVQGNFTYIGLDFNSTDATLTAAIATAGASRTLMHIIPSVVQRDRCLGFGVRGLMIAAVRACVPHP